MTSALLTRFRRGLVYARGFAGLRRDDILLVSYPKSGNTWVRFFLRNYLAVSEGESGVVGFGDVDGSMPELGADDLTRPWQHTSLPRFVKTHLAWHPLFRGRRSVLVVRDPRDVMVSYYHFDQARRDPRYSGDFAGFIRHPKFGLRSWFTHTRSWLKAGPVLVGYEALRADAAAEFGVMLGRLGLAYDEDTVREAAERSRFENVSRVEAQLGHPGASERFREGARFTRQGSSGGWTKYFTPEDEALYQALRAKYPDVTGTLGL